MRSKLEPIFLQDGVDVGLNGHEHFYERSVLRGGVQYFTSGAGGALRKNDITPSSTMAAGFDADNHFIAAGNQRRHALLSGDQPGRG
jgi:hypothetical protein